MALFLGDKLIGTNSIGTRIEEKDVNFYDYEGTLVASYTKQEALALTSLPPLPDRTSENLTNEGWNWTLAEIKDQLDNVGGIVNVGCTYYTTDGKTHIFVEIDENALDKMKLRLRKDTSETSSVVIDWGDGNTTTVTSTSNATYTHTYQTIGTYDISISGIYYISDGVYIFGEYSLNDYINLTKLLLGRNFKGYIYYWLIRTLLKELSIPSINTIQSFRLYNARFIKHVNFPRNVIALSGSAFGSDIKTETFTVSIPPTYTALSQQCFNNRDLTTITIPKNMIFSGTYGYIFSGTLLKSISLANNNIIPDYFLSSSFILREVRMNEGITTIGASAFYYCALKSITIPSTVTTIGASAFSRCYFINAVYVKALTPPTIEITTFPTVSYSSSTGINPYCKFYVPRASLTAYQTATNWSDWAANMIPYDFD